MRPNESPQRLEDRRRQALHLLKKQTNLSDVARQVGVHRSTVLRWAEAFRNNGWRGLRSRPNSGRPSLLDPLQKQRLTKVLIQGPLAWGYSTDLWTLKRIAQVIRKKFRVPYHPSHVWRLLQGLGWSCQKTGEESAGEKRESHPAVETAGVAAYKKTLKGSKLAWRSSTRAASFWSPISPKPGLPEVKLRLCAWPETGRRYRRSPRLRSVPNARGRLFISVSIPTKMSARFKSANFFKPWPDIFKAPSFSSGTEARLIAQSWFRPSCAVIPGFIPTSSRAMLPNLTRTNSFGASSNDPCPTWSPKISSTLNASSGHAQESSKLLNETYGLAFTHLIYPGVNMLHYLYKCQ